ncbi:MAG: pyridoxamine 5'-phosphate oxidase [Candidatus Azotimanducaceae bacterium]|jgi:pyridoxamine 5'-phosphate oxidase
MNPSQIINQTRQAARQAKDQNSETCFLAIASKKGVASLRTLVLRNISDNNFTLYVNKSSPKWHQLSEHCHYELLLWYPTQQKQFRINGTCRVLEYNEVSEVWKNRPASSKYMDALYQNIPQSAEISSRAQLKENIESLKRSLDADKMVAPQLVSGVELQANKIEILDLAPPEQEDDERIHDRRLFRLAEGHWQSEVLVP